MSGAVDEVNGLYAVAAAENKRNNPDIVPGWNLCIGATTQIPYLKVSCPACKQTAIISLPDEFRFESIQQVSKALTFKHCGGRAVEEPPMEIVLAFIGRTNLIYRPKRRPTEDVGRGNVVRW